MYHYERILYAFSEQGDVTQTEIHFQVFARLRLRTQTCVLLTQLFKDAVTAVGYQSAFIVSMITVYGKEGNMEKMEYYFNIAEKHRLLTDVVWLVCSCNCTDFTLMSYSESNPLTDDGELVRAGIPAGQGKGVLRKSKSGRSALITAFASFFFFLTRQQDMGTSCCTVRLCGQSYGRTRRRRRSPKCCRVISRRCGTAAW